MSERFRTGPEVVDGHVRFNASIHGRYRDVFVLTALVEAYARRPMSRRQVETYVTDNAEIFIQSAERRVSRHHQPGTILIEADGSLA